MNVEFKSNNSVVNPQKDLRIFGASEFHGALVELSHSSQALELDLHAVVRLDSSGLKLVMAVYRDLTMNLTGISQAIRDKFKAIGCGEVLPSTVINGRILGDGA